MMPSSPIVPVALTMVTRPEKISSSALTMSQWMVIAMLKVLYGS
jgi:hypothetical protein